MKLDLCVFKNNDVIAISSLGDASVIEKSEK